MRRCPEIRRACLTAVVALAVLAAPAGAAAQTFCVNDTACVSSGGTAESTIQAAFAAATVAPPPSTVLIGPGSYGGSPTFNNSRQITVRGAGEDQTVITINGHGAGLGVSGNSNDLVSSLSIQVTGDSNVMQAAGLTLGGGTADHIAVSLAGLGATGFTIGPGTITNSTVTTAAGTPGAFAVDVEGGPAIIQDSTFTAPSGVGGGSPVILQRDTINASDRAVDCLGTCLVEDSVISMSPGSNFGLLARCSGTSTGLTATNDTIVGPVAASVGATCGTPGLAAGVAIDSSIIRGGGHALQAAATDGAASATITPTYDDYDPGTDAVGGGPGAETIADPGVGQINADPLFIAPAAGDFRVPWNSPAVDHGNPAPLGLLDSTTDLAGNPRVAGGRRDIGALEYTAAAPTAAITQDAHTAPEGHTVRFDGSHSSDPNPGDTLTYAWTADDGATGTGTTFAHAFAKPGTHSVTLTVADPTGLTATATVTVTVTAAPPPSITRLRESRRRWSVGAGTTFSFRLNSAATVRLVFSRHGHTVAALSRRCHAGQNRIHFSGRLKHGRHLGTGPYTVSVTAKNSVGASRPRSLKFRVL